MSEENSEKLLNNENRSFKIKAGIYLASVAGIAALFGFGATLASVKKKDPKYFNKGVVCADFAESGSSLALRALGWGTLYATGGCAFLCFAIWKLSGAHDLNEFRIIMGSKLPRLTQEGEPKGRTEFEGLGDLFDYIITEGQKKPKNLESPSDPDNI